MVCLLFCWGLWKQMNEVVPGSRSWRRAQDSACFWLHLPFSELKQIFTNVNGNFSRCFFDTDTTVSSKFSVSIWVTHPEGLECISTEIILYLVTKWFVLKPKGAIGRPSRGTGSKSQRPHGGGSGISSSWVQIMALWPQETYTITLSINFFIRKMGVMILIS